MINKKGMTIKTIAKFTIVFVLLVVVGFFLGDSAKKGKFIEDFIPGFNQTSIEVEESKLGYTIYGGNLNYYNGNEWKKIDVSQNSFSLNDYEFSPAEAKTNFVDFFFFSERRPTRLTIERNHWIKWFIGHNKYYNPQNSYEFIPLNIYPVPKQGYSYPRSNYDIERNYDASKSIGYPTRDFYISKPTISYEDKLMGLSAEDKDVQTILAWKNSILDGNSCEKFISLKINGIIQNYSVKKQDYQLYIDLDEPVYPGTYELWQNESCFEYENYEDIDRTNWVNEAELKLEVIDRGTWDDDSIVFTWKSSLGWTYENIDKETGTIIDMMDEEIPFYYRAAPYNQKDFFGGLNKIINGMDGDYYKTTDSNWRNFWGTITEDIPNLQDKIKNIDIYDSDGNLMERILFEDIAKEGYLGGDSKKEKELIYTILNSYNTYLKPLTGGAN